MSGISLPNSLWQGGCGWRRKTGHEPLTVEDARWVQAPLFSACVCWKRFVTETETFVLNERRGPCRALLPLRQFTKTTFIAVRPSLCHIPRGPQSPRLCSEEPPTPTPRLQLEIGSSERRVQPHGEPEFSLIILFIVH